MRSIFPTNMQFLWDDGKSEYYKNLITEFELQKAIRSDCSELELLESVLRWISERAQHDGNIEPQSTDPYSILKDALKGHTLRCVEFAIVAAGILTAFGKSARVLCLKTEDVETRKQYAGHVAVEVFLERHKKWAFVDPQFTAILLRDTIPQNAYEIKQRLHLLEIKIVCPNLINVKEYKSWLEPYLFYFDVGFDQRHSVRNHEQKRLMLLPLGAKAPQLFQGQSHLPETKHITDHQDFYSAPRNLRLRR